MKKNYQKSFKALLVALLVIGSTGCKTAFTSETAEPVYNGKPLSDWLVLSLTGDASAREAIGKIGAAGIPTLIDLLGAKESNRRSVLRELKSEQLKQEFSSKDSKLEDLRNLAVNGFIVLGTNAEPAIPQLLKQFRRVDETCFEAAAALSQVGPRGISALTNSMSDENLAAAVVWAFGQPNNGDPKVITQVLITALRDPDPATRGNAARFLQGKDHQLAIPALLPMLDEKEYYPLNGAILALGSFGTSAKATAPKLFSVFTNVIVSPDLKYAHDLTVALIPALQNIDKQTAAEAEAYMLNGGPQGVAGAGWTITGLPGGKKLIAGGSFEKHVLSRAQLFDPTTGRRTETGSMNTARQYHAAILLPSGKVLVAGGQNLDSKGKLRDLLSAELYDPKSGKWTETTSMHNAHTGSNVAFQPDGKVLIYSGGFNDTTGAWWDGVSKGWSHWVFNEELYNPSTEEWTVPTRSK